MQTNENKSRTPEDMHQAMESMNCVKPHTANNIFCSRDDFSNMKGLQHTTKLPSKAGRSRCIDLGWHSLACSLKLPFQSASTALPHRLEACKLMMQHITQLATKMQVPSLSRQCRHPTLCALEHQVCYPSCCNPYCGPKALWYNPPLLQDDKGPLCFPSLSCMLAIPTCELFA